MKTPYKDYICAPVDLPLEHSNTLDAAAKVAIANKLPLKLIHVVREPSVQFPATYSGTQSGILPQTVDRMKAKAEAELEALALRMKRRHGLLVECSTEVLVGFVENRLMDIIQKEKPRWTILPASEDSGILNRIFGDIPSNLAKSAGTPVMVVPDEVEVFHPRHIAYLIRADREDPVGLEPIAQLAKGFKATLEVMRVSEKPNTDLTGTSWEGIEAMKKIMDLPDLVLTHIDGISLDTVLESITRSGKADLIVMHHTEQGLFDRLLQGDRTRTMVNETEKPLVVL